MNSEILLRCINLCKSYQEDKIKIDVLRNISFNVRKGEMISIIGSSGSGKSTLLNLLGGLDTPTSGDVFFCGQSINNMSQTERAKFRNRELGFIYQFHHLLPDFTVFENVSMPLLIGKAKLAEIKTRVYKTLKTVSLEKRIHHYPSELSGGERQRVAIARALVTNPQLVLADEPTGNLDPRNSDNVFQMFKELNLIQGNACLVTTHNLNLAKSMNRQMEISEGHLVFIN